MTDPLGNSKFCFPQISMLPSTSSQETLRFSGNKTHLSPLDQSLSVNYCLSCQLRYSENQIFERYWVATCSVVFSELQYMKWIEEQQQQQLYLPHLNLT